jgi:hypothetical protein
MTVDEQTHMLWDRINDLGGFVEPVPSGRVRQTAVTLSDARPA